MHYYSIEERIIAEAHFFLESGGTVRSTAKKFDVSKSTVHKDLSEKLAYINSSADLIAALKEKPGRAAVLDVSWPEPPVPGSPLYAMDNVILTPHAAGSIGNEIQRMGEYMAAEYAAFAAGQPTKYEVTEQMLETMA